MNGPLFGIWHIDGHGYQWQIDRQAEWLPLEACIRIPGAKTMATVSGFGGASNLTTQEPLLRQFDRQPIVLRMNNITSELDATFPRISPLTEDNWHQSFLAIRRLADGNLDDTPTPSPWAGTEKWAEAGKRWATSVWMRRLQEIIPNPSGVILRENNEGPRPDFDLLYSTGGVKFRNHNNVLEWAYTDYNLDPSRYLDANGNPFPVDTLFVKNPGQIILFYRWKSKGSLDAMDLRAEEWVAPRRGSLPAHVQGEFVAMIAEQYAALYSALDADLTPSWRGKLRTCAYGGPSWQADAGSLSTYMGDSRPARLTDPAHAKEITTRRSRWQAELLNPRAWRELSIRHRGPTIFADAQAGTGDFVDAESFAGFMAHYCWAMQQPGREVRLTAWEGYLTKPDATVVGGTQTWKDALTQLGRADLIDMTVGDCELAVMREMQRIHDSPTISRYWREGTTRILSSPQNDAKVQRVYATETTIPGVAQTLLYVYSPCTLTGPVQVADQLLPDGFRRSGYYLTNQLKEVQ